MTHLLSGRGLEVLAEFARSRPLLAFDFDGTLAPTVPDRHRAQMRVRTGALFSSVCRLYACAVISGRSRQDVRGRLGGAPVREVVGNHGLEPSLDMRILARQIAAARAQLETLVRPRDGIEIEDKRYSLALHYRHSSNKPRARRSIRAALARLSLSARVVPGKLVINVLPAGAPHKGDALLRLWREAGTRSAIYVGDDVTDEDAFRLDRPQHLLAIRIGRSRASAAPYYLRNQQEMDSMLAAIRDLGGPVPTR